MTGRGLPLKRRVGRDAMDMVRMVVGGGGHSQRVQSCNEGCAEVIACRAFYSHKPQAGRSKVPRKSQRRGPRQQEK